jgi:HlyD family secretion protein
MDLKTTIFLAISGVMLTACSESDLSDAYGQFEANGVTISAESSGILTSFDVKEGMHLDAGTQVGLIDTAQISLRKKELEASIRAVRTQIAGLDAQAGVYKEQLATARKELVRFTNLKQNNAATQQQIDQVQGQVNVHQMQIASIDAQKQSVYAELETMQTRIEQVEDQLQRARIINPIDGIVISKYAEPNELVSPGKPLYELANLGEMELRVYISGAQLPNVKLGAKVEVLIDRNEVENEVLRGEVSWIASEAEFTPRMIQTREERVTQVYAVKVRVPNPDGKLKIGMPGEVNF